MIHLNGTDAFDQQIQDGAEATEVDSLTGKLVIDVRDTSEDGLTSSFTFLFEISQRVASDEDTADADGDESDSSEEAELTGAEFQAKLEE